MAAANPPEGVIARLKFAWRAMRSRNYRLFFAGQGLSLIGTMMQRIAVNWLVYRMTGSAFWLGLVNFCGQFPGFLAAPFAGVVADRVDRRRLLIVTQAASMIQALILAALTLTGVVHVWHVLALSLALGLIHGFDSPARQSFVLQMVDDRDDLPNAIALNSLMFNSAALIGPAVAGLLIMTLGEGACFLLNGLSYVAVLASLCAMRIAARPAASATSPAFVEFQAGVSYAFHSLPIRSALLVLALTALVGVPYDVLLPVVTKQIIHGDAQTFGFLTAAVGVGAIAAALALAARRNVVGLATAIGVAMGGFGAALVAFSFSRSLWLSLPILTLVGFAVMTETAACNTVLQTVVPDEKRGRIMGFFAMALLGMSPLGSLLAGSLAATIGAPRTLLLSGVAMLLGAAWFARLTPQIRRAIRGA
jgi:MFS family permease